MYASMMPLQLSVAGRDAVDALGRLLLADDGDPDHLVHDLLPVLLVAVHVELYTWASSLRQVSNREEI